MTIGPMSLELYQKLLRECPDCGKSPPNYEDGPRGGLSINIFCLDCGAGFNVSPDMKIAQRIGKRNEPDSTIEPTVKN